MIVLLKVKVSLSTFLYFESKHFPSELQKCQTGLPFHLIGVEEKILFPQIQLFKSFHMLSVTMRSLEIDKFVL